MPPKRPPRGRPRVIPTPPPGSLLTVVRRDPDDPRKYLCRCACGKSGLVSVRADRIANGLARSCGCLAAKNGAATLAANREKRWIPKDKTE